MKMQTLLILDTISWCRSYNLIGFKILNLQLLQAIYTKNNYFLKFFHRW